jgi:hypothetical protein
MKRIKNYQNNIEIIPSSALDFFQIGEVSKEEIRTGKIEWNKDVLKNTKLPKTAKIELKFTTQKSSGLSIIKKTNQVGTVGNPKDLTADLSGLKSYNPQVSIHIYTGTKKNYIAISDLIPMKKSTSLGVGMINAIQEELPDNIIFYSDISVSDNPTIIINNKLTDLEFQNEIVFYIIFQDCLLKSYRFLIDKSIIGQEESEWMKQYLEMLSSSGYSEDDPDGSTSTDKKDEIARDMVESILSHHGKNLIEGLKIALSNSQ